MTKGVLIHPENKKFYIGMLGKRAAEAKAELKKARADMTAYLKSAAGKNVEK